MSGSAPEDCSGDRLLLPGLVVVAAANGGAATAGAATAGPARRPA